MRAVKTLLMWVAALTAAWGPGAHAQSEEKAMGEFRGAMVTEKPAWFKESFLDFEEDIKEAAAQGRRLMLYFYQDGCPYCNRLVEHNFTQKDIYDKVRENFDVIAINMWGDREVVTVGGKQFTEKTLAAALRVSYTPTLLFFDENREVVLRLDGYYPPENFRIALDYVAGHHETAQSYSDYHAAQTPAPPASGQLHDEPFFARPPHRLNRTGGDAARPLAVFFEQKQCTSCDTLHEKALRDPATRELIEQFDAVQLDMWADTPVVTPSGESTTAKEWARSLGLHYAPSIVLFDRAGTEVMRSGAYLRTFHLQSVFDYVLSGSYQEQPSFQRFISARADHLREQGIDVDLWHD